MKNSGFGLEGSGIQDWGFGCKVCALGYGLGFRVMGLAFRV